jgi:hypothetical protein
MGRAMRTEVPAGLNGGFSVPGIQSSTPPGDLAVAVARLLAIAVGEMQRHHAIAMTSAECVPNYRSWPVIQTVQRNGGGTVRFYVCPKGVLASGDELFPVGTQFVMEKSDDRRMEVFVMKKYAALHFSEHAARGREVWMSTCYLVEDAGSTRGRSCKRLCP